MTLEDYRALFGWSKNEMAREAKIDINTLNRALDGEAVTTTTANRLARAISIASGKTIRAQEIEGLNIK